MVCWRCFFNVCIAAQFIFCFILELDAFGLFKPVKLYVPSSFEDHSKLVEWLGSDIMSGILQLFCIFMVLTPLWKVHRDMPLIFLLLRQLPYRFEQNLHAEFSHTLPAQVLTLIGSSVRKRLRRKFRRKQPFNQKPVNCSAALTKLKQRSTLWLLAKSKMEILRLEPVFLKGTFENVVVASDIPLGS